MKEAPYDVPRYCRPQEFSAWDWKLVLDAMREHRKVRLCLRLDLPALGEQHDREVKAMMEFLRRHLAAEFIGVTVDKDLQSGGINAVCNLVITR